MPLRIIASVLIALTALAAGCAQPRRSATVAPVSSESSAGDPSAIVSPVDWDNKCMGDVADSLDRQSTGVSYDAYVPKSLGTPIRIVVCPPLDQVSASQAGDRAVVLIYDDETYGRVIFEQYPFRDTDSFPIKAARVVGAANPGPGVELKIVTIRGGLTAILTNDSSRKPSRSHVIWVENGMWFTVLGPTLTSDQVLTIANGA